MLPDPQVDYDMTLRHLGPQYCFGSLRALVCVYPRPQEE